jgi:hypothetical protein
LVGVRAASVYIVILMLMTTLFLGACYPSPVVARPRDGAPPVPQRVLQGRWLKNHAVTDMWSGPADQPGVTSFGKTSTQFCIFQQRDQHGDRLYVFNPYSEDYFWIDASAVGPVDMPAVRPGSAKPVSQNCADAVFTSS